MNKAKETEGEGNRAREMDNHPDAWSDRNEYSPIHWMMCHALRKES